MINDDFINNLERLISFPAKEPYDRKLWGFWCDGIYCHYHIKDIPKIINDKRVLKMTIDYGRSGQDLYTLIIHFGKRSLSRNARGLNLNVCTPDFINDPDSISIDEEKKVVEIQFK